jgi:hypothetical protein
MAGTRAPHPVSVVVLLAARVVLKGPPELTPEAVVGHTVVVVVVELTKNLVGPEVVVGP